MQVCFPPGERKWACKSYPILCNPICYSPPCSTVHGILQARILDWVAIIFSRGSSWTRDQTWISHVSCIAGGFFTTGSIWEACKMSYIFSRLKSCLPWIPKRPQPPCFLFPSGYSLSVSSIASYSSKKELNEYSWLWVTACNSTFS